MPDPSSARDRSESALTEWLRLAAHPATVRRASIAALIVGALLIVINHGPALLAGQLTHQRIAQMCLTVLVPYAVSTVSSVATRKELAKKKDPA
ncbi:MAG TPA: nitrate/nitrite transporter NrtS [Pseudomonadales bacterium]|nr:nitrate/nitrite transporter NrtS [Pseudomonadales bacterium]